MNYSYYPNTQNNRLNQYLVKEILEASPQQIIIKIYDFAIASCSRHDLIKTNNAIQELINALRFDDQNSREIAVGLFRLYYYCQEEMRNGNHDSVKQVLTDLRDAWVNAIKNYKA
ncbi:MAG: flagellar protein FliS [Ignavibacteriales bacterium]|nr:flagellar protein FliS [Ignavibacteriales bacterium]